MEIETRSKKTLCVEDLRRRVLTQALEPGDYLDEPNFPKLTAFPAPPLR